MAEQEAVAQRKGREGGRWLNERPTSEEFATWFRESMKVDPKLNHGEYVGGVVLIPAVDTKAKYVTGFTTKGVPVIEEREELSYIPYAKVETRINYFWDLIDVHPEWVGVVEPVVLPRILLEPVLLEEATDAQGNTSSKFAKAGALAEMVHQLPEGFSLVTVPVGQGYSYFLCSTIRVSIFDREALDKVDGDTTRVTPRRSGRGTKQVPLLSGRSANVWADPNSLMKAETGALGRALGFAGIFIIPGSGVATAEDMLEALAQGTTPAEAAPTEAPSGPAAPTEPPTRTGAEQQLDEEATRRKRAAKLWKVLSTDHPDAAQEFGSWARERRLGSLNDARGAMLTGVVRKLEKLLDEAVQRTQQGAQPPEIDALVAPEQPTLEEATDVPTETSTAPASGSGGGDGESNG